MGRIAFIVALTALWSPFVTIGILPIIAAQWAAADQSLVRHVRAKETPARIVWPFACSVLLIGLIAAYFQSRNAPLPFLADPASGFMAFANQKWSGIEYLVRALIFIVFEVGVLAVLVWWARSPETPRGRALFFAATGFLLVLPFIRYGRYNDLSMRASIPCLMVLAAFLARALIVRSGPRRMVLVAALVVAGISPLNDLRLQIEKTMRRGAVVLIPQWGRVRSLWEVNEDYRGGEASNDFFFRQYIGSRDSFFFRRLARDSASEDHPSMHP
jgi:NADH:ubiquinone oxidoreductase subunit 3 (subunit A)